MQVVLGFHGEQFSFLDTRFQVAASMRKDADAQIPSYPNLPSKLICILHSVTMLADPDTDEVYARMTLQPVSNVGCNFPNSVRSSGLCDVAVPT